MVTVASSAVERTFLQAVNKAFDGIGENPLLTLVGGGVTKRGRQAMSAVELARDEIYYHTMWKFRRDFFRIDLATNTMWYELPADFQKMATGISRNVGGTPDMTKVSYEKLCDMYPDIRAFPPGTTVSNLATLGQLTAQDNFGEPEVYCTELGYVGLMLIPDADFVELEGSLYASYWKHAPQLLSDHDDIGLPRNLWQAHQHLSVGYLKKTLEYSDWATDKTMGINSLGRESSGAKSDPDDMQIEQQNFINYNE